MKNETVSTLTLEVGLSSAYGSSTASVLIMALREHRDYSLRAIMSELKDRNLDEAFNSYSDYQDCVNMLDSLIEQSTELSYRNHLLANTSQQQTEQYGKHRRKGDFQLFLKEFSLTDPNAE